MIGICPTCEKETNLTYINHIENIAIRGENIPAQVEYIKCSECDSEFADPNASYDVLEAAYRQYRNKHNMVQPEVIKQFRESFGFTQNEFANLLGLGGATLSRYENGALQDDAHNTLIALAMQPVILLEMIEEKTHVLTETKRARILSMLHEMTDEHQRSFASLYESRFGSYPPGILSGYQGLSVSKLLNAMVYFCGKMEIPKTKLNKLLFYADFKHFKEYSVSITGVRYIHLQYGPVPDNYEYYLAALIDEEQSINKDERPFNDSGIAEYLLAIRDPDLSIFSTSELKILASVKEYFSDFTATKISTFSHEERAYQSTHKKEIISYDFAKYLRI